MGIASIRRDLPARDHPGGARARGPRAQRQPGVHRLHRPAAAARRTSTTNAMLEPMDPDKDADGLHPMNLGRLVPNVSGPMKSPLPCTPAGIVELLRPARHPPQRQARPRGRPRRHHRPPGRTAAHPQGRQRHGHPGPHRHGRPARRTAAGRRRDRRRRRAAHDQGRDSSRAPSCSTSASPASRTTPARPVTGTWTPPWPTSPPSSPNPGGVGPMTRAMLLANVVEAAELSLNR